MNTPTTPRKTKRLLARRLLAGALAGLQIAAPQYVSAATDIANSPISSASTTTVPPNVMFILDASGSMDSEYMPDEMDGYSGKTSYANHLCNTIYYNPSTKYLVPKKADGTDFPVPSFTAAKNDGFINSGTTGANIGYTASGTTDLRSKFRGTTRSPGGGERAFYYRWTGTTAPTTAQCQGSAPDADNSGSATHTTGNWTKVQIPAGDAAQEENFAIWFTYYRTRMLLMKTAGGRAFNGLNDTYRVGFITICPDGSSCNDDNAIIGVNSNYYLKIDAFNATHKANWYTKFYQQEPSSFTPLRQALARVGRHYAGYTNGINSGMNDDPIQFSCQQNFAILTTDGYWNYGRGKTMANGTNGTADIGNHDNNSGVSPRPLLDTGPVSSVVTQEYFNDLQTAGTNGCAAGTRRADRWERTVTTPQFGSASTSSWTRINNNTCYPVAQINTAITAGCTGSSNPGSGTTACNLGTTTTTAGSTANTLADVAAYYYQNDLRPSMTNNVPSAGTGVEDDNAPHQHMTTFTLGMGLDGQLRFDPNYRSQSTGDFADIRSGAKNWPNPNPSSANTSNLNEQKARIDDLWHAAVNGRGQYFSAKDPTSLASSLVTALTSINARLSSAAAAATSTLEPTAGDNLIILPTYTTQEWTGEIRGHLIDVTPGSATYGQLQPTPIWSAQTKLDNKTKAACDNRTIKLFRPGAADNLVDFTWNTQACDAAGNPTGTPATALNTAEQDFFTAGGGTDEVMALSQYALMTDGTSGTVDQRTPARGANLVNFLRGQRGKEGTTPFTPNDANKLYRQRKHVLGDIVNSQPLFVRGAAFKYADTGYASFSTSVASRQPMVYVAGNDGMLHAFTAPSDSTGGEELWAFIPRAVLPRLHKLADANYANLHEYFVDGRPMRDDVYDSGSNTWKTILVGGLNKGGRGYYALDITNPTAPKALWEFTHDPGVCGGAGQYADCHLGYTFGNPVITKLKDGRWVVVVTSGYNNINSPAIAGDGEGYLYVLEALTGRIIYKIGTGAGDATNPSGLAKITAWVNSASTDNTAERVYGTDLLGNIWRFDINDERDATSAPVLPPAGREATRLTTLKDPSGNPQPITIAPRLSEVGSPPSPYVFVATGQYLGVSDVSTTQVQSVYAIKDTLTATAIANPRQSLAKISLPTSGNRTATCNTATGCNTANGWFSDLPDSGERVNVSMELQLGTLVVASNVPANSACEPGGYGYLNFFDTSSGLPPPGTSTAQARYKVQGLTVGLSIVKLPDGTVVVYRQKHTGEPPAKENVPIGAGAPTGKRVTWRELMQ
jgi:type IV pilus assembly protein PilY1